MIKQIVFVMLAFVLIIPISVLAQDSLTCPKGSYHGLDNAGNDACRDIKTNKIIQGISPQNNPIQDLSTTDPCTNPFAPGCISLQLPSIGENSLLIFGVIAIVFVILIVIAASKRKKPEIQIHPHPTDWTTYVDTDTGRMMWTCAICKQKFSDKDSYLNHGCHFR